MAKYHTQFGSAACGLVLAAVTGCVDSPTLGDVESRSSVEFELNPDEQAPAGNRFGVAATYSSAGAIDFGNAFFRTDLGTNGRSCASCHDPRAGWTVSSDLAEQLFDESNGLDPLFRLHDAGTRPDAPIATSSERKQSFKPVTKYARIRFGQSIPAAGQYEVIAIDDPTGFGTTAAHTRFRRPNPTSNAKFVSSLTWTAGGLPVPLFQQILFPIAVNFHAQGPSPSAEINAEGAEFAMSVFHAQVIDNKAGRLDAEGAKGGPVALASFEFTPGMNSGENFNPKVFDLFDAWENSDNPHRRKIWRGQEVFNTKTFGNGATCGGCHNTPNVGSSSSFVLRRVGTDVPGPGTDDLPKLTIRNKTTGEVKVVTDVGAGLNGNWNDIGRFKVQHLRGLASRAPFFHDGRAKNLHEVIDHYDAFFNIGFTDDEKADLAAFLYAL